MKSLVEVLRQVVPESYVTVGTLMLIEADGSGHFGEFYNNGGVARIRETSGLEDGIAKNFLEFITEDELSLDTEHGMLTRVKLALQYHGDNEGVHMEYQSDAHFANLRMTRIGKEGQIVLVTLEGDKDAIFSNYREWTKDPTTVGVVPFDEDALYGHDKKVDHDRMSLERDRTLYEMAGGEDRDLVNDFLESDDNLAKWHEACDKLETIYLDEKSKKVEFYRE